MSEQRYPEQLGFKSGTSGTHTSRTLMFAELSMLLAAVGQGATREEFVHAVVEENVLGKSTASTRRISAQRLTELYALDTTIPIFRLLQKLWATDRDSQPLLALLSGLARDPLLRCTASAVIGLRDGQSFDRDSTTEALKLHAGKRLNEAIIDKVVRNSAASWTQSGHLTGRTFKKRQRVKPTAASVTMALFLGFLQGLRGGGLLKTLWCEVLDSTPETLAGIASRASTSGLMRFRQSGDVIEIGFPELLTNAENERTTHG
jgi:hypothetical protein